MGSRLIGPLLNFLIGDLLLPELFLAIFLRVFYVVDFFLATPVFFTYADTPTALGFAGEDYPLLNGEEFLLRPSR